MVDAADKKGNFEWVFGHVVGEIFFEKRIECFRSEFVGVGV